MLQEFSKELEKNKRDPDQIKEVTIYMSPAFIAGVNKEFKNAFITFDKFHIIKLLNQAVDQVRMEEVKLNPILKGTRYIWLHNPEDLTERQRNELTKLSKRNLKKGTVV